MELWCLVAVRHEATRFARLQGVAWMTAWRLVASVSVRMTLAIALTMSAGCLTDFAVSDLPHRDAATDVSAESSADATPLDAAPDTADAAMDAPTDQEAAPTDVPPESACGDCTGSGMRCCGTTCADITLDFDHCGSCAIACLGTTCSG